MSREQSRSSLGSLGVACGSLAVGSSLLLGGARPEAAAHEPVVAHAAPAQAVSARFAANGVIVSPAEPEVEPEEYCARRFRQPLEEVGLLRAPNGDVSWETIVASLPAVQNQVGAQASQVVVATVADPIDSGFAYQFDTTLQALRLGAEQALPHAGAEQASKQPARPDERYYRDRAWLPWDDRSAAEDERALSERCRSSTPGVLVFRRSQGEGFMLVLLVGETPTRGVHTEVMAKALQMAGAVHAGGDQQVRVVGPTFSGSAQSFRRAIREWAHGDWGQVGEVRIWTGAATGAELPTLLRSPGADGREWSVGRKVEFFSTIGAESSVRCAYLKFLQRRLGVSEAELPEDSSAVGPHPLTALPDVAFLHESGTEFGTYSMTGGAANEPACPASRRNVNGTAIRELIPGLDLSFPVHVSRLRDAYEEMDKQTTQGIGIARRTSLGISLREPRRPIDLPEPSARSVFAQDIALTNLLDLVVQGNIRHVGIQATDIGDAIFLARKLRDISPDVRVAFLSADVLAMHPIFERDLTGSLVVSPYPFLGTGGVSKDSATMLAQYGAFESTPAVGIYNAMLAARGADTTKLREYVFGDGDTELPVWTSALVRGRLLPISVVPARDPEKTLFTRGAEPSSEGAAGANARAEDGCPELDADGKRDGEKKAGEAADEDRGDRRRRLFRCGLTPSPSVIRVPRSWHLAFGVLCLAAALDYTLRRRAASTLSGASLVDLSAPPSESEVEQSLVRTKWHLYAALRSGALTFPLGYMAFTNFIAHNVYATSAVLSKVIGWVGFGAAVGLAALAVLVAVRAGCAFTREFMALWRYFFRPARWQDELEPGRLVVADGSVSVETVEDSAPGDGATTIERTETIRPPRQEEAS